jgi:hypothetical protein
MQLSGDPAFQYTVDDAAAGLTAAAAAEPAADSEDSGKYVVTEVQRLRCIIDGVNSATAVQPKVRVSADVAPTTTAANFVVAGVTLLMVKRA